jgi:alanine racemase
MYTWAEVDLQAVRANADAFRRALGGAELIAVVKANAYGHGAVPVAQALVPHVDRFAVATPEEALELRRARIRTPILVLYPVLPETAAAAILARAEVSVSSLDDARVLHDAVASLRIPLATPRAAGPTRNARWRRLAGLPVHIKVNTGMNRYGVEPSEVKRLLEFCAEGRYVPGTVRDKASPRLRAVGIWTHFASADDPDDPQTEEQYARFRAALAAIDPAGMLRHAANSAAMLNFPHTALDGARIGIALYGAYPSARTRRAIALQPALAWRARVTRVEVLRPGEAVSYNRLFTATEERRIATVAVGYADGYPRLSSNRAAVLIRGKRAPVVGRVCMDALVCDVGHIPDAHYGDTATLIGRDGEEEITADEFGAWAETISYEVFTGIGRRVQRVYRG